MAIQIPVDRERLTDFCRRHHIRSLAFFGSVLREAFDQDSDVDVLVEFEEGYTPGWELFDLERELSGIVRRSSRCLAAVLQRSGDRRRTDTTYTRRTKPTEMVAKRWEGLYHGPSSPSAVGIV